MIQSKNNNYTRIHEFTKKIILSQSFLSFKYKLEKMQPYGRLFSSSCGGLQPLGANGGALRAHFFRDFLADFLGKFCFENFVLEFIQEIFFA